MKTNDPNEIKTVVREKYGALALQSASCCGPTNRCGDGSIDTSPDEYQLLEGYLPDADLRLGCGLPTKFADIKDGEIVVDMTEEIINRANDNKAKMEYQYVEFRLGEIENLPVQQNFADVIISNCVLNLVPDKKKAFAEIARVLKPGGRFSISDLVVTGPLPEGVRSATALYIGCIAGASTTAAYLQHISDVGLERVTIESSKKVELPEEVLKNYASESEVKQFLDSGTEVLSITVTGYKPR